MTLQEVLRKVVSFEAGLITYLSEVPMQASEAHVHIYIAEYQDPTVLCNTSVNKVPPATRQASGAGLQREDAIWSTIGEAIERYSSSNWMHLEQKIGVASEFPGALDFLAKSVYFSKEDYQDASFQYAKPDPNKVRSWLQGRSLSSGREYFVPSSCACMNYEAQQQHEIMDRGYSTGLASHTDLKRAIYAGLCEVIERDAFSSYWLAQAIPDMLAPSLLQEMAPIGLLQELDRLGLKYRVFALRTDIEVPVITCSIQLSSGGIATGASCNLNCRKAIEKAIVEAMHTHNWCLDMKRLGLVKEEKLEIDDFPDHVSYYLKKERSDNYLWWKAEPRILTSVPAEWLNIEEDESDRLALLSAQVTERGFDPIWVDLTSPDVHELGFYVVKAFVPGLQPLSAGYLSPQTNPVRVNQLSEYLGINWSGKILLDPPHAFP